MKNLIIPLQIIQISVVLINALSLWLVFLINKKTEKTRIAQLFTLMIALMLIWVDFAFLSRVMPENNGLTFIRLAWSITPLFFILIYFFIEQLLGSELKFNIWKKGMLLIGLVNIPFVFFTPLVIKKISLIQEGIIDISYGGWEWVFFGQVLLCSFLIIYTLIKYLNKKSKKSDKVVVKYLLLGFSIFLLMNSIFNIALPIFFKNFNLYAFGDYSTIIFLSFIAYAITKKNLFGIKVVLSTMAVGFIAILLLADFVAFTTDVWWVRAVKLLIFISFVYFGKVLIKSVTKEIERREELEELSDELVDTNIKLKEANKKLKKLDKAKSEFISIASHQLRTPLTAIKGYLSMIVEGSYGEIPDEAKEKMESVLGSSERLINLVNDLLNVSRIESGKIDMNFEKINLNQFIKESIKELEIVAEEEGLYLNFKADTELTAEMDEKRMRQVVLNIIDNAIKYTEEGGITIRLKEQKLESGKDAALIEIEDTGKGMTQKDIDSIFESFSRGSAGDLMYTEGAGLGLYIARKFVDMHNGSIWIESDGEDEGTCFFIELPLKQS
ncbi:MAG: ATP-binding protein [Patescibacteria group bacterium]